MTNMVSAVEQTKPSTVYKNKNSRFSIKTHKLIIIFISL